MYKDTTNTTRAESNESNVRPLVGRLRFLKSAKPSISDKFNQIPALKSPQLESRLGSTKVISKVLKPYKAPSYLNAEDIKALENPEIEWSKCIEDIKCYANWVKQFEACNIARKLCKHHTKLLTDSPLNLHNFILDLLMLLESQRSPLVKNALLVFVDLFTYVKREIDLDLIVPCILKKGVESDSFLVPHVINALRRMCENCSEKRVINALLNSIGENSKMIVQGRVRVIQCLNILLKKMGSRISTVKEGEVIISTLVKALSEDAIEIRNAAKEGLAIASDEINNSIEFKQLLKRLTNTSYKNLLEVLGKTDNSVEEPMRKINSAPGNIILHY